MSDAAIDVKEPVKGSIEAFRKVVFDITRNDTGASAELRRMDVESAGGVATLHRALAKAGVSEGAVAGDGLARWATIGAIFARSSFTKGEVLDFGQALAKVGVSELRVSRLLNARGAALRHQAELVGRRLASASVSPKAYNLAKLILNEGRDEERADEARKAIASAYFRKLDSDAAKAS